MSRKRHTLNTLFQFEYGIDRRTSASDNTLCTQIKTKRLTSPGFTFLDKFFTSKRYGIASIRKPSTPLLIQTRNTF